MFEKQMEMWKDEKKKEKEETQKKKFDCISDWAEFE